MHAPGLQAAEHFLRVVLWRIWFVLVSLTRLPLSMSMAVHGNLRWLAQVQRFRLTCSCRYAVNGGMTVALFAGEYLVDSAPSQSILLPCCTDCAIASLFKSLFLQLLGWS